MSPQWIFGYGSLIFRPAFPSIDRAPGRIRGYVRRFWQASTDHRGTPASPGRVVTLVPRPGGECFGVAYQVAARDVPTVLEGLDEREKGGYHRIEVEVELAAGGAVQAIAYYADAGNENFIGEAPLEEIARIARSAEGPSGRNDEYIRSLAEALRAMGARDEHVFALESAVRA